MDLREQKPPVFTNRDCIKKTWTERGVAYISELALENARALPGIIHWNHEHGIRFFRRALLHLGFRVITRTCLPDWAASRHLLSCAAL